MVRQPSLNSGQPGVELFRPAIYDVVDFNSAINELAIHAGTVGERKLYREVFGKHLFGDKGTFGESDKYTLDPIRTQGEACLACDDIPGMEEVVLTELHLLWGGAQGEIEIRRAHNIFLALAARDQSIPSRPKIVKAKFAVRFTGSLLPRKVTVSVPNRTNCRRHEDREIVEEWLQARGFYADRSSSTPLFDWLRRSA
jgi:hypothetical protein